MNERKILMEAIPLRAWLSVSKIINLLGKLKLSKFHSSMLVAGQIARFCKQFIGERFLN